MKSNILFDMVKLNYKVEGNGKAIVFIHGLSDNLSYWEVLTSGLKKNYKVIRFDLQGHGESDLDGGEINVSTYADDLNDLLEKLGVDKVNLVGFSLGGAVALDFAIRYPSKVSSIVLMSTFFKSTPYLMNVFSQFFNGIQISFEEFYDLILPMVLCPDVILKNKKELEFLKQYSSQMANTEGIEKAILACMEFDVGNHLSEINAPTLILAGKYDEVTPLDIQKEMNEKITSSEMIVLDNVRHNLLVGEKIKVVMDILDDFLKK